MAETGEIGGSGVEPPLSELLAQRTLDAAPLLLGRMLRVGERAGRIVEVEAYEGADDPASHAANGPTSRSEVMFGPVGVLYVYRIYGMHWCANVVSHGPGQPGAILIRALEPTEGVEQMWTDRPKARRPTDLCSGPGKLCAALGIEGRHNGVDLLNPDSPVSIAPSTDRSDSEVPASSATSVVCGPRIGITKAADRPWRFAEADNAHVSRPPPTTVSKG